ncbi:MAG: hypothetical protein IPO07_15800 [Haliscomenobacter sp.]|nr:trehalase family glycosidase [Haliscomenobacter sp.]MBK9490067.1 hypothetical protein [Haliscomenobacter sp.]
MAQSSAANCAICCGGLHHCTSALEQYALGLGHTYTDHTRSWDWLQQTLASQANHGSIPNVQQPQASTLPFHSILAWHWWKKDPKTARIEACYEALLKTHAYWYEQRDPHELGLPCIHFVEESLWPESLQAIYGTGSFQVQDPGFLALLCRANECLADMGEALGKDLSTLLEWQELTVFGLNEDLWDDRTNIYCPYDVVQAKRLPGPSLSNYLPMWAGVPDQEQAERLGRSLVKSFFREEYWALPTQIPQEKTGETETSLAVSPLLNRLMYTGLIRYGFVENANYLLRKRYKWLVLTGFIRPITL